jgi:hypothetical protein
MSKMCGDTARFHRIRKQRNVKRARVRELREEGRSHVEAVTRPRVLSASRAVAPRDENSGSGSANDASFP